MCKSPAQGEGGILRNPEFSVARNGGREGWSGGQSQIAEELRHLNFILKGLEAGPGGLKQKRDKLRFAFEDRN